MRLIRTFTAAAVGVAIAGGVLAGCAPADSAKKYLSEPTVSPLPSTFAEFDMRASSIRLIGTFDGIAFYGGRSTSSSQRHCLAMVDDAKFAAACSLGSFVTLSAAGLGSATFWPDGITGPTAKGTHRLSEYVEYQGE